MKLLVTGGAGFIGSNFIKLLFSKEMKWDQIIVVDNLTYAGNLSNISQFLDSNKFIFHKGDISDERFVKKVLEGVHSIVNFAAESHVDRSINSSRSFVNSNVLGTQNLLHVAKNSSVRTFVQISTDEVYGSINSGSWDENQPLKPNSPYAASKASSDHFANAYYRTYGMDVRITRCSNNYGPYQNIEKAIPRFITNLISGKQIPLYGSGGNIRDWLHVDDHCHAIELVLEKGTPGGIYNVGGGEELTNRQLVNVLLQELGCDEDKIDFVEDRKGHDFRYSVDFSKIKKELGYEPKIKFSNGIRDTIKWYKNNYQWWKN